MMKLIMAIMLELFQLHSDWNDPTKWLIVKSMTCTYYDISDGRVSRDKPIFITDNEDRYSRFLVRVWAPADNIVRVGVCNMEDMAIGLQKEPFERQIRLLIDGEFVPLRKPR